MNKVFSNYLPKGITNKQINNNNNNRGRCLPRPCQSRHTSKSVTIPDCVDGNRAESEQGVHQDPPPHVLKTGSLQVRRRNPLLPQRKQPKFKLPRGPNRTSCKFRLVCSKSRVPRGTEQKQSSILRFKKSSLNNCVREMDRSQSRRIT